MSIEGQRIQADTDSGPGTLGAQVRDDGRVAAALTQRPDAADIRWGFEGGHEAALSAA